jgi:hypothetical protein
MSSSRDVGHYREIITSCHIKRPYVHTPLIAAVDDFDMALYSQIMVGIQHTQIFNDAIIFKCTGSSG